MFDDLSTTFDNPRDILLPATVAQWREIESMLIEHHCFAPDIAVKFSSLLLPEKTDEKSVRANNFTTESAIDVLDQWLMKSEQRSKEVQDSELLDSIPLEDPQTDINLIHRLYDHFLESDGDSSLKLSDVVEVFTYHRRLNGLRRDSFRDHWFQFSPTNHREWLSEQYAALDAKGYLKGIYDSEIAYRERNYRRSNLRRAFSIVGYDTAARTDAQDRNQGYLAALERLKYCRLDGESEKVFRALLDLNGITSHEVTSFLRGYVFHTAFTDPANSLESSVAEELGKLHDHLLPLLEKGIFPMTYLKLARKLAGAGFNQMEFLAGATETIYPQFSGSSSNPEVRERYYLEENAADSELKALAELLLEPIRDAQFHLGGSPSYARYGDELQWLARRMPTRPLRMGGLVKKTTQFKTFLDSNFSDHREHLDKIDRADNSELAFDAPVSRMHRNRELIYALIDSGIDETQPKERQFSISEGLAIFTELMEKNGLFERCADSWRYLIDHRPEGISLDDDLSHIMPPSEVAPLVLSILSDTRVPFGHETHREQVAIGFLHIQRALKYVERLNRTADKLTPKIVHGTLQPHDRAQMLEMLYYRQGSLKELAERNVPHCKELGDTLGLLSAGIREFWKGGTAFTSKIQSFRDASTLLEEAGLLKRKGGEAEPVKTKLCFANSREDQSYWESSTGKGEASLARAMWRIAEATEIANSDRGFVHSWPLPFDQERFYFNILEAAKEVLEARWHIVENKAR